MVEITVVSAADPQLGFAIGTRNTADPTGLSILGLPGLPLNGLRSATVKLSRNTDYFILVNTTSYVSPSSPTNYSITANFKPFYSFEIDKSQSNSRQVVGTVSRRLSDTEAPVSFPVSLKASPGSNADISAPSDLFIHGAQSNSDAILNDLYEAETGRNVWLLDWRGPAAWGTPYVDGVEWIPTVGQFAAEALRTLKIDPTRMVMTGHSWGEFVAAEAATQLKQMTGKKVGANVSLDAPTELFGKYLPLNLKIQDVFSRSWSFLASPPGITQNGLTGSVPFAKKANESYLVSFRDAEVSPVERLALEHRQIPSLYGNLATASKFPNWNLARVFDFNWLRTGTTGPRPVSANAFSVGDNAGFEGQLTGVKWSDGKWIPAGVAYRAAIDEPNLPSSADKWIYRSTLLDEPSVYVDWFPSGLLQAQIATGQDGKPNSDVTRDKLLAGTFNETGMVGRGNPSDVRVFTVTDNQLVYLTFTSDSLVTARLERLNAAGTAIATKNFVAVKLKSGQVTGASLPPGTYAITVTANEGKVATDAGFSRIHKYTLSGSMKFSSPATIPTSTLTSRSTVRVDYAIPNGATQVSIERTTVEDPDDSGFEVVATLNGSTTNYNDAGLAEEEEYVYRVVTEKVDGSVDYSLTSDPILIGSASSPASTSPAFLVSNTNDSGPGSLRQAILNANLDSHRDVIQFVLPEGDRTIRLQSPLPTIVNPVWITGNNGDLNVPPVVIDCGQLPYGYNGLRITANETILQGLDVRNSRSDGVVILGSSNLIFQCRIIGHAGNGILIYGENNIVGGSLPSTRNVIGNNARDGVYVFGVLTTHNTVEYNYVGVDTDGTPLPNGLNGITLMNTPENRVRSNVVGANLRHGILVTDGWSQKNELRDNLIGLTFDLQAVGNGGDGIRLDGGSSNLVQGNVSVNNQQNGILMTGGVSETKVYGNRVGTEGRFDFGNAQNGIAIIDAPRQQIGGSTPEQSNLVSGNEGYGIAVIDDGAANSVIAGNTIGVDAGGTYALGNQSGGILVSNTHDVLIGGADNAAGNVVAASTGPGINVFGASGANVTVQFNLVGTTRTFAQGLGNGDGIQINNTALTRILDNTVIGNRGSGIRLTGSGYTQNTTIARNLIGSVDATSDMPIPNAGYGIVIEQGVTGPTVIGGSAADGNVILSNLLGDILDQGQGTLIDGNVIPLIGTLPPELTIDSPQPVSHAVGSMDVSLTLQDDDADWPELEWAYDPQAITSITPLDQVFSDGHLTGGSYRITFSGSRTGEIPVTVTATGSEVVSRTITISRINSNPTITLAGGLMLPRGGAGDLLVLLADADADPINLISATVEPASSGVQASFATSNLIHLTAPDSFTGGDVTVSAIATDGLATTTSSLTVTVSSERVRAEVSAAAVWVGQTLALTGTYPQLSANVPDETTHVGWDILDAQGNVTAQLNGATASYTPTVSGKFTARFAVRWNVRVAQAESVEFKALVNTPPMFKSNPTVSVPEGTTSALTVQATDADLPVQAVTYRLSGGADQSVFQLAGDGALSFRSAPNFEVPADANRDNVYEVQVTADDGFGGTASQLIRVTVTNVNEAPKTLPGSYTITENSPVGTVVGIVQAFDPDLGDVLTNGIANGPSMGNTSNAFSMDSKTGAIKVNNPAMMDFETYPTFKIYAGVVDREKLSSIVAMTINLKNVDEPAVIGLAASANYKLGDPAVRLDPLATFKDVDSATLNLNGALLTVSISGNRQKGDVLDILAEGTAANQINVKGNAIRLGTTQIGILGGGKGSGDLTVTFNTAASLASVQAVLRRLSFNSNDKNTSTRTIDVQMTKIPGLNPTTNKSTCSVLVKK